MASYMNYNQTATEEEMYFPDINSSYKRMKNTQIGMPVKKLLKNQRVQMITSNPQNTIGTEYLREKFKLPDPNKGKKFNRQIGGPSLNYGVKPHVKTTRPKRILPKKIRDDPFADGPKITEDDLSDGMMSLLNRGIIPKNVDVTPAFERGKPPFEYGAAKMYQKTGIGDLKYNAPALMYKKPQSVQQKKRAPGTFITAEDEFENHYLNDINRSNENLINKYDSRKSSQQIVKPSEEPPKQDLSPAIIDHQMDEDQLDYNEDTHENQPNEGEGLYSMYQLIIKGGKVVENSPEYMSFKRTNITKWGAVSLIIYMLEKLMNLYHIPNAVVDGNKLVTLAEEELTRPNEEELLDCIINYSQVMEIINNPKKKFKGPKGPELAAI